MPNLFRTLDGKVWKPSQSLTLTLADGTKAEGVWGGSAQREKLDWWLRPPGNALAQTEEITAIAIKGDETKEMLWGDAPAGARLFFVLEAQATGNSYRLAKMVTTAANPAQRTYFHHERFSLFGKFKPDGSIEVIAPVEPPPPRLPDQGELF